MTRNLIKKEGEKMKKTKLCVNLFCEDCGDAFEDYGSKREALKARNESCVNCGKYNYHWCEFFRMEEEE